MIRVENRPDVCFPNVNLLTFPLIMYSKFVWSNLVWSIKYGAILVNANNKSFLVCASKITSTPESTLWECLWLHLIHPAFTTIVHTGIPSNVVPLAITYSLSDFPADNSRLVTSVSKANPSDLSRFMKEYCDSEGMSMLISCFTK